MRFIPALAALLIQAQTLPPPFPRDGATRLLDNDRGVRDIKVEVTRRGAAPSNARIGHSAESI